MTSKGINIPYNVQEYFVDSEHYKKNERLEKHLIRLKEIF